MCVCGRRGERIACSNGTSHRKQKAPSLKFRWGRYIFSNITEGRKKGQDKARKEARGADHFVKRSLYFPVVPNWPINF
jgi:hypothetical protein